MKFLRHLLGTTKLDKEKNQCIRGKKTEAQSTVKEIKQYQKQWLQHVQRMDTNRLPKQVLQYRPKGRRTREDQGRGGGTNFILKIKEQDDDDDDDDELYEMSLSIITSCEFSKELMTALYS